MLLHVAIGCLSWQHHAGSAMHHRRAGGTIVMRAEPPIEVLAARQRTSLLLMENWPTIVERLGGVFAGDCVRTASSELHGLGLVATRDIEAGELIAFHPVHRVLQQLDDGRTVGALAEEEDKEYFRPAAGSVSPEEAAYRQVAYCKTYYHVDPSRPERFIIDANPQRQEYEGWLAHRINDGATLSPGSAEAAVAEYYEASAKVRNCCAVSLCVPLLAFIATKDVAEGDELLATYGHNYWMQGGGLLVGSAEKLAQDTAREADLFQVSTDKKYSKQISALEEFIARSSVRRFAQLLRWSRDASSS